MINLQPINQKKKIYWLTGPAQGNKSATTTTHTHTHARTHAHTHTHTHTHNCDTYVLNIKSMRGLTLTSSRLPSGNVAMRHIQYTKNTSQKRHHTFD
jgi:hypothetical protein